MGLGKEALQGVLPVLRPPGEGSLPSIAAPLAIPWCEQVGCSPEEAACARCFGKALFALIVDRELVLWVTYGVGRS